MPVANFSLSAADAGVAVARSHCHLQNNGRNNTVKLIQATTNKRDKDI